MSIKFVSAYTVKSGDTLESIATMFRLSSGRAVAEIAQNKPLRALLVDQVQLPAGLLLHIPPNAAELTRERLYALHRLRAEILSHFDALQALSDTELRAAVLESENPGEADAARRGLAKLRTLIADAMAAIVPMTEPLVTVCHGMSQTHVAQETDHAVVNAVGDPMRGLYWAVTPAVLQLWQNMWEQNAWLQKWRGKASDEAWEVVTRYATTIRSLVVQQIDQRIRDALALERELQAEASRR